MTKWLKSSVLTARSQTKINCHFFFSEIGKVRNNLFQINGYVKEPLSLPDPVGAPIIHTEKVYVPVKEHPEVSVRTFMMSL